MRLGRVQDHRHGARAGSTDLREGGGGLYLVSGALTTGVGGLFGLASRPESSDDPDLEPLF